MEADRNPAKPVQLRPDRAALARQWTPEEAMGQAATDAKAYVAFGGRDSAERSALADDMKISAQSSPDYQTALRRHDVATLTEVTKGPPRPDIIRPMTAAEEAASRDAPLLESTVPKDIREAVRKAVDPYRATPDTTEHPITPRDGVVGAAHGIQALGAQGGLKAAAQTIGAADAALVATDLAQGKEVRPLDAATAAASVIASAKLGGPALQAGAQAVAAVGAVDMTARAVDGRSMKVTSDRLPIRDEADRTGKAQDLTSHISSETFERQSGLATRNANEPIESIAGRVIAHQDAIWAAKAPALDAMPPKDTEARLAMIDRRDIEVVSVETAQRWAQLGATDYRRIDGAPVRAEAAEMMASNNSWRYQDALRQLAPDVAAAVRSAELEGKGRVAAPDATRHQGDPAPGAGSTVVEGNGIELLALRRGQDQARTESPEVAELRRLAIEERGPQPVADATQRSKDSEGASPAPAANDPTVPRPVDTAQRDRQQEHDSRQFVKEVLEAMTAAEIVAFSAARARDPAKADKLLETAAERLERSERTATASPAPSRATPSRGIASPENGDSVNVLEDRFNVRRTLLIGREYEYRDKPGQVAFKEGIRSMRTTHDDVAVVKGMLDRASERGWGTIQLNGSAEFKRQAWIAAEARGIKAVGYTPTQQDRMEAGKEAQRLAPSMQGGEIVRPVSDHLVGRDTAREAARPATQARPDPVAASSELKATPSQAPVRAPVDSAPRPAQEPAHLQDRTHVGRLVDHGAAPYQFQKGAAQSYYARLATPDGDEVVWGVDMKRALDRAGARVGQQVELQSPARSPVTVTTKGKDAQGIETGQVELDTYRNSWRATVLDREQTEQRAQSQPSADRVQVMKALDAALESSGTPEAQRTLVRADVSRRLDAIEKKGQTARVPVYDSTAREAARSTSRQAAPERAPRARTTRAQAQHRPDPDLGR